MKKYIICITTTISLVACKKLDQEKSGIIQAVNEVSSMVNKSKAELDSADFKMKDWKETKEHGEKVIETTKKIADSIQAAVAHLDLEKNSKKEDSVASGMEATHSKDNKVKPRRDTKIIYKEVPAPTSELTTRALIKKGSIAFYIANYQQAKNNLNAILAQRNARIKNEETNFQENDIYSYFVISVPTSQYDDFISDLENSLGQPFNKSVNVIGTETRTSTYSTLNLTFYPKSTANEDQKKHSLAAAFVKGWKGIESVFLFLLPFWPLLLIGLGIFFYRKKQQQSEVHANDQNPKEPKN